MQAAGVAGFCHGDAALNMSAGKNQLSNLFNALLRAPRSFPSRLSPGESVRMAWAIAQVPRRVRHVRSFVGQVHFSSQKCTGWKKVLTSGKDTSITSEVCKVGDLAIQIVLISFGETYGDGILRISLAVHFDVARDQPAWLDHPRRVCVVMFGMWIRITEALFAEATPTGGGYRALLFAIPREIMDVATFQESEITMPIGILTFAMD